MKQALLDHDVDLARRGPALPGLMLTAA